MLTVGFALDGNWEALLAGGDERAQQCGGLRDRFGVSWQVVPTLIRERRADPPSERTERVMAAILRMKKRDFVEIERAARG